MGLSLGRILGRAQPVYWEDDPLTAPCGCSRPCLIPASLAANCLAPSRTPLAKARSGRNGSKQGLVPIGLTYIKATIANPRRPKRTARVRFLVDSGAAYSVVPAPVLTRLGIKPTRGKSFILADGSEVKRRLGETVFRLNGEQGASPVIFGEKGDSILLGSVSLQVLGLLLDPFKLELRPLPMLLAAQMMAAAPFRRHSAARR